MNKKDLKTGMVVEYRNGELRLVVGGALVDEDGYEANDLRNYHNNLKYSENPNGLDIIAVYNDFEKSKCLWKRREYNKKEIINQLHSLKDNSESMIDEADADDIFKKDVEVLNIVIDFIEKNYE